MKHLEEAVRAISGILFWKNSEGVYQFVNRNFLETMCMTEDQVIGKKDSELFPAEMADYFRSIDLQIIETGQPVRGVREQVLVGHGETITIKVSKSPIFNEFGEVMGIIGYAIKEDDEL